MATVLSCVEVMQALSWWLPADDKHQCLVAMPGWCAFQSATDYV